MNKEEAYKIRKIINERDELKTLVENLSANNYLEISYDALKPIKRLILLKNDELFKTIIEYYKQKLFEYDQEIENL